jgi:hypothetical protein
MTLTETIQTVQRRNEKDLATRIAAPVPELDDQTRLYIQRFQTWCKSRGVPAQPAAPTTVAAYIRAENAFGVDPSRIFDATRAIELWHDSAGLSSPCATISCRTELERIMPTQAPRSWSKADRLVFQSLSIEAREIILKRATQDELALRRLQNKTHEFLSKQSITTKGTTTNE